MKRLFKLSLAVKLSSGRRRPEPRKALNPGIHDLGVNSSSVFQVGEKSN